jgi:hypothetical protein
MKNARFRLVVMTNQPDVGHGLIDKTVVEEMHSRLAEQLPVDAMRPVITAKATAALAASPKRECCGVPRNGSASTAAVLYDRRSGERYRSRPPGRLHDHFYRTRIC